VWDAETGKPVGAPLKHQGEVNSDAFSPDGRRVVTASADRAARVWDVLLGSASPEDAARLADLAEAVGGYQVNELGSPVFLGLDIQRQQLNKLRQIAGKDPHREGVDSFVRQFLSGLK
jgi:WD40 repeat protein